MTRLLRLTAPLAGLCLLLLTLGGILTRSAGGGARAVIVQETYTASLNRQAWWLVPGTSIQRPIPSPAIIPLEPERQSADRRYFYWTIPQNRTAAQRAAVALYRLDLTSGQLQPTATFDFARLYFSPDDQWIVYERLNREDATSVSLYRTRADGSDGLHLTADFAGVIQTSASPLAYHYPTQFSADGQWVYFTAEARLGHVEVYRVPLAGGAIEQITDAPRSTGLLFWPPHSAWPIVMRDGLLYWLRPDGGELRRVLPFETTENGRTEQIMAWLPDDGLLIVARDDMQFFAARFGDDQPVWEIRGPYRAFVMLDDWVILYGSAVARMRPDGSDFTEFAGMVGADAAFLVGFSLDHPALVFFREFPGSPGLNFLRVRLSDEQLQSLPITDRVAAADLLANVDWRSPYLQQIIALCTVTNLELIGPPAQRLDTDFIAVGPPIDRKLQPFALILISGGLLAFGFLPTPAPRRLF